MHATAEVRYLYSTWHAKFTPRLLHTSLVYSTNRPDIIFHAILRNTDNRTRTDYAYAITGKLRRYSKGEQIQQLSQWIVVLKTTGRLLCFHRQRPQQCSVCCPAQIATQDESGSSISTGCFFVSDTCLTVAGTKQQNKGGLRCANTWYYGKTSEKRRDAKLCSVQSLVPHARPSCA